VVTTSSFVRRVNPDSTTDLICLDCSKTVATAKQESELTRKKNTHACEPVELEMTRYINSQRGTF
jgi:hypothetical protein